MSAEEKILPLDKVVSALAPMRAAGRKVCLANGVFDLLHVGHGYFAPAQAADESQHRRFGPGRGIQCVANLADQHPAKIRRAERVIAVDHSHGLEAAQRLREFFRCKRPEPAHAHKTDLLSFPTHLPDSDFDRR